MGERVYHVPAKKHYSGLRIIAALRRLLQKATAWGVQIIALSRHLVAIDTLRPLRQGRGEAIQFFLSLAFGPFTTNSP